MSKIEELKQLMSIDACNTVPDIQQHFDHIAKLLFVKSKGRFFWFVVCFAV